MLVRKAKYKKQTEWGRRARLKKRRSEIIFIMMMWKIIGQFSICVLSDILRVVMENRTTVLMIIDDVTTQIVL